MSTLTTLQAQIDGCNSHISSLNSTIAAINSETSTDPAIIELLAKRKSVLQLRVDNLNDLVAKIQEKYNEEVASSSYTFTPDQQAIVDTLLSQYSVQMDMLLKMPPEQKNAFFTLYNKAQTSTQHNCVVCDFFNI